MRKIQVATYRQVADLQAAEVPPKMPKKLGF